MTKAHMQINPNMMVFSGDNISLSNNINNIPNGVINESPNSISAPLQNNLELNVSIPNSEKLNLNLNNGMNMNMNNNNNLRGAYLSNINLGNLSPNALGIPNLPSNAAQIPIGNAIINNQSSINAINNNMNLNAVSNNNLISNDGINLGLLGNNLGAIPSNLNASLLPQPIPIQLDKNVKMGISPLQGQPILNPNAIGISKI